MGWLDNITSRRDPNDPSFLFFNKDKGGDPVFTKPAPSPLTYEILGHNGGEGYESIRQLGGKIYGNLVTRVLMGELPEGRAKSRTPRDQSQEEIRWWIDSAMETIGRDIGMGMAQAKYKLAVERHQIALQNHNQVLSDLFIREADLIASGKDTAPIQNLIERVSAPPPAPEQVALNRMTDVELAYVVADAESIYMRTRGYPRNGAPYRRRWEVALEEWKISLDLSTGNNSKDGGRFQERRADINRDNMLDTMVLRTLDRRQVNPYFTLRDGINSVRSDMFTYTSAQYEDWLGYVRGMIAERDRLLDEYGPAEKNPFGVAITKGRAYEVLVRRLGGQDFDDPGGPNFGEVMTKIRKEFGDHPAPRDAVLKHVVIHGAPEPEATPGIGEQLNRFLGGGGGQGRPGR